MNFPDITAYNIIDIDIDDSGNIVIIDEKFIYSN